MASVVYDSLVDADVVEVEFLNLDEEARSLRLLVDTGFTGSSSLVLPSESTDLVRAVLPARHTTGALHGLKDRGWVTCRIPGLDFQATMIAIITETSSLALPPGIAGLAGLTFLRHFASWGGKRSQNGWQFFLSDGRDEDDGR